MSRTLCENCHYPKSHCLCDVVTQLTHRTRIIILQHPSEVKAAKNTARLLQLSLQNAEIWIGESPEDFLPLHSLDQSSTFVVYPDEKAVMLEEYTQSSTQVEALIFLDGTWKKAFKLLQLNNWLTRYPFLSFAVLPTSRYTLRKAPRADSLSTLEAVAYSLATLENIEVAPLYALLDAMMQQQFDAMPPHIRSRYHFGP
ncbi:tRNA-uridine aminocarboxypropyltransferase [Pseudoalteromonas ulvae]|uniref:tRNA-uridine aminocarboxypropyltransferase n=1 Tax=Pseudoalteromonas ulvae TaxID=107327 RepID=A0A244CTH2_PSEDV|nr:tRNA-uridine aminocarboxypropyltransferase [Pseudoalteromonas ulvae]OUL58905.1 hypothetical protein B1199_01065 [Pseudoalteromonas ulvae]